jgi:hypothetical protein
MSSSSRAVYLVHRLTALLLRSWINKNKNGKMKETELVSTRGDPLDESDDNDNDETETLLPSQPIVLLPEERKLLQSSVSDDLLTVFHDVRFIAPFTAILFGLIGAYLVIDPFAKIATRPSPMSHTEYVSPLSPGMISVH